MVQLGGAGPIVVQSQNVVPVNIGQPGFEPGRLADSDTTLIGRFKDIMPKGSIQEQLK
jgi:hypothetical protein